MSTYLPDVEIKQISCSLDFIDGKKDHSFCIISKAFLMKNG